MNYDRRAEIIRMLQEKSPMHINELMEKLGVTAATIRRDLMHLEQTGDLIRTRGMAHLRQEQIAPVKEIPDNPYLLAKRAIAKAALKMIPPSATLILDAGSTTLELAKMLVDLQGLHIVTNSVAIANQLAENNMSTFVGGGNLYTPGKSCIGPEAESVFEKISVAIAFMATSGIRNGNFTTFTSFETNVKHRMVTCAERVIMLADASKFGINGIFPFASFDEIDCLITSAPIADEQIARELAEHNVEVVIAEP